MKEDRFFTEAELENFNDIDAASVREQLQQSQTSAFVEQVKTDVEQLPEEENPAPSVRDSYEHYKPLVKEQVLADQAYQNACVNSDRETALMEGNEAIKRAAQSFVDAKDMTFVRLYSDMAEFHSRLHREILDETYPVLSQSRQEQNAEKTYTVSTVPTIFCEWSESPVFEDGKTYSLSEFDRLMRQVDDEFTAGKKAAMEKYGTWQNWYDAKDVELSRFLGYNKVKFTLIMPDGRTLTERQDIGDGDGGVLDFLSQYDAYRDMIPILRQAVQREQEPPDLSGQPITREGDTITIGGGDTTHEADITISDKQWQEIQAVIPDAAPPARDPMAPAYNVGDKVYLDNTEYIIEDISPFDVQLRDPAQAYPILRAETKGQFEKALWKDSRNGHITEFMPADLSKASADFREVLTSGLLSERDKDYISDWLRSGESNTRIAQRLSEQFAGQTDTFMLKTGEHADYFASAISIEVHILDEENNKKAAFSRTWQDAAPLLRALWQQDLDGLSRAPVQRPTVWLEGKPSYQVGNEVFFRYGDREISGTIGSIGEMDVRIDTGPYAWSHQTVSRDFFEEALRQDERNAHRFVQEPEQAVTQEAKITAIYPGDKNGLPYDVVVQTLRFNEPEHAQPEQAPVMEQDVAAGNFRITDDHLGEGGPKAKFRMNAAAITTLHEIEFDGRSAAPEEQEILSRYVGWGALADAFDPDKPDWADEYKELQVLLSPEEYKAARASVLNAHYARFVP